MMRVNSGDEGGVGHARCVTLGILQAMRPYMDEMQHEWEERCLDDSSLSQRGDSVNAQLMDLYRATLTQGRVGDEGHRKHHFVYRIIDGIKGYVRSFGFTWSDRVKVWVVWGLQHSRALLRLHLAMFYIAGVYYDLPHRLLGIRYLQYGKASQGEPGRLKILYRTLGVLLALQAASSFIAPSLGRGTTHAEDSENDGNVKVIGYDGSVVKQTPAHRQESVVTKENNKKCPLCLSERRVPTATLCGHVFCWECIGEWCSRKPECPLCRAEAPPGQLVPVRHADI
jgi:hypothetical protein